VYERQVSAPAWGVVITAIVLGLQVRRPFGAPVTIALLALAGLLAWRANRTLLRVGWI